jgi:hypothetical protein
MNDMEKHMAKSKTRKDLLKNKQYIKDFSEDNFNYIEEALSIISKSEAVIMVSPYGKMRRDVFLIRSILMIRSNTAALLLLMLIKSRSSILTHREIRKSITPNSDTDLKGNKIIRVYMNDIRNKLEIAGFGNPIKSHHLSGYSIGQESADAIDELLESGLKKIMGYSN